MRVLAQAAFAEPEDLAVVADDAVVVHQRTGSGNQNNRLVLFVHGLGGSRYGRKSTWGRFPAFVFEDMPSADVGLYEYRTLFGRLRFWKSIALRQEAEIFADLIRDELRGYASIVLVGHSMGGLLCKAAIARLHDNNEREALSRVGGLMLMATPQLGSIRVPKWLAWLSHDFRVLKPHNDFVASVNEKFENNVCSDERAIGVENQVVISTWAVRGASDFWVDQLSAGLGLVSSRRKRARGSHKEIVKPSDKTNDVYQWVKSKLEVAFSRFKYDVFIASPMASVASEEDYAKHRNKVLEIEKALMAHCNFRSIFSASRNLPTKADFDANDVALVDDLRAIRESRYFMLLHPERSMSSTVLEAGVALAYGRPSVYFVRSRADLPFLMMQAEQALPGVKIHEYASVADILKLITKHGERLWHK